jgi:hypothetical protein
MRFACVHYVSDNLAGIMDGNEGAGNIRGRMDDE